MYLLGSFVTQQFTGADLDDIDFFAVPGDRPDASAPTPSRRRSTASWSAPSNVERRQSPR